MAMVGLLVNSLINLILFTLQGSLSARIFDQIRIPETQMKSWKNDQCEVCATGLNQLKREAVAMVHTLEESQFLAYYNIPGYMVGPNANQLIRRADKQRLQAGVAMETNDRGGVMYVKPEEAAISSSFLSRWVVTFLIMQYRPRDVNF